LLLFLGRRKSDYDDAEPENTTAKPKFAEGEGTEENPFVLKPAKNVKPGDTILSKELIRITDITPGLEIKSIDYQDDANGRKFSMQDHAGSDEGVRMIEADEEGSMKFRIVFDDSHEPTLDGGEFRAAIKIGHNSVYLLWDVNVKADPEYVKEQKKLEAERKKAEKEAEQAEAKAAKEAKAAEEKAAKEAEQAEAKAAKEAKAAEEKAAAAASAAAAKKTKDEADAKKKADAEAKAKKEAEEAEKKAKADAEAKAKKEAEEKAKKAAAKPAPAKEVKKQEELKRVKSRAKTIDFKTLGTATESTLKTEVKKGASSLEVANAAEFEESGTAALRDENGSSVITWTGKQGNSLTGVTGVTRVFGKTTIVVVKDDLQVIKGIGPFIEEKLNALGITTYRQIANMTAKLEDQVNEAIEFFPGRVKRDQWVAQAKILLGEDVKLDEKALKEAEELERIAQKAESIDFETLGVATFDEKDDLQIIKGIGPFIAEKLYALGIYTFEQVGNMTPKIEEEVNKAIEFFPGRVKRDEWAKQAKELAKNKK
jgi:predicted flap endonuclease-1-like 5' DNA nuclease